ncbi:sensor histidine kinase [Pseudomarimonas arenosa]|uniref:Histidine kinase n=1 Tax=Pseudomarimonas arenosa TaxID=2774145 RepID=A0AAW3ZL96_9GAMM|nr:histidine kinase [Pseudomarimonas arenosa]MBD8526890.1 histidine kinase [Pseudomarimonas arenosa]
MSEAAARPLHAPLPAEAVVGGLSAWFSYQRYPIFGIRWLLGRLLYVGAVVLALSLLSWLGNWAATGDLALSAGAGALLFGSFMLMFFAGPALACWVRHRRWEQPMERYAVVAAVLLGMVCSYFVDAWASAQLEPLIEQRMQQRGMLSEQQVIQARQLEKSPLGVLLHLVTLGIIYLLMGGGLALRGYFSEQRRLDSVRQQADLRALQQKAQHDALKLGVLQAQVEPHFLFNTLASIRSLLRQDPARAEATLDALVDHLRATMPRLRGGSEALSSTLSQQVEICRSYLELMRLRLDGRLDYAVDLPAALAEHPFPPLLLITLVENAVKHGIEPKRGAGHIAIRADGDEQQQRLSVRVEDDGVGLQTGAGSGVGLANIRAQLSTAFAGQAELKLQPRADGGVVAEIHLPLERGVR